MATEWVLSAVITTIATPVFGHFETVRLTWIRILRWLAYLAITGLPHVDWFIRQLVHLAGRQAQHRRGVGAISPLQEQSAARAT